MALRGFVIVTAGPIMNFYGTLEETKRHVERFAPMKRGWTAEWEQVGVNWYYRRSDSKGRSLPHLTICIYPGAIDSQVPAQPRSEQSAEV